MILEFGSGIIVTMNFSQINFGFFALKIYGLFISVGFALASWYYYKQLKEKGFSQDFFLHHYWRWLLGGILLGRLLAVLLDPTIFERFGFMSFFAFWDGEMNLWGVGMGFLMTMYLDLKKESKSIGPWLDVGMLPFLLMVMIADWAAFLTGKIYGTETSLPWGIQYETFGVEILNPVHPVTLYAFVAHLILYWWVKEHQKLWKNTPGVLSLKTLLYFCVINFGLEFLYGSSYTLWGGLSLGQYISLGAGFVMAYWLYGDKKLSSALKKNFSRRRK